jgi:hypothetical protein
MVILNSFSYLSDKTNLDTIPIITFFLTFFIALIFEKKEYYNKKLMLTIITVLFAVMWMMIYPNILQDQSLIVPSAIATISLLFSFFVVIKGGNKPKEIDNKEISS